MREKDTPATFGELMGKTDKKLSLSTLKDFVGDKMPDLPRNRVGKYRLTQVLKQRWGPGFRNVPEVQDLIKEFDREVETENIVKMNLEARNGNVR